jgi:hypothetical protein
LFTLNYGFIKGLGDAILAHEDMLKVLNDPNATNRDKTNVAKVLLDMVEIGPIDKKEIDRPPIALR